MSAVACRGRRRERVICGGGRALALAFRHCFLCFGAAAANRIRPSPDRRIFHPRLGEFIFLPCRDGSHVRAAEACCSYLDKAGVVDDPQANEDIGGEAANNKLRAAAGSVTPGSGARLFLAP